MKIYNLKSNSKPDLTKDKISLSYSIELGAKLCRSYFENMTKNDDYLIISKSNEFIDPNYLRKFNPDNFWMGIFIMKDFYNDNLRHFSILTGAKIFKF